jgi:hypothetical protein
MIELLVLLVVMVVIETAGKKKTVTNLKSEIKPGTNHPFLFKPGFQTRGDF